MTTATDKPPIHSPFTEREENHRQVISGTLTFVVRSMAKEVISAVCEVQLGEIDGETKDEANPESDPQRFSPEIVRQEHGHENVENDKQNFVVAGEEKSRCQLMQLAHTSLEIFTCIGTLCPCQPWCHSCQCVAFPFHTPDGMKDSTNRHVRRRIHVWSLMDLWAFRRTYGELDERGPSYKPNSVTKIPR